MKNIIFRSLLLLAGLMLVVSKGNSQSPIPEELSTSSVKDQIKYIETKTLIYENFRAIREDIFQKLKSNILDTISAEKSTISGLRNQISLLNLNTDTLKSQLQSTNTSLNDVTRTKNQIRVLGIQINKTVYNSIMFVILAALVLILAIGFLIFKRVMSLNISTNKELKALREEFESYRQSTRIAREKMSMDHFNEIRKLRGNK